jgi:hypothetical protein
MFTCVARSVTTEVAAFDNDVRRPKVAKTERETVPTVLQLKVLSRFISHVLPRDGVLRVNSETSGLRQ